MKVQEIVSISSQLKSLLFQCNEDQKMIFKRMYSHKNLELPINEVIDNMKPENLTTALRQVNTTVERNLAKMIAESKIEPGYAVGEICNRNGCKAIILEHDTDTSCSCHSNPPCSHCTTSREYCPECDWDGREEQIEGDKAREPSKKEIDFWATERKNIEDYRLSFYEKFNGKHLPITEFQCRKETHTHFSMKVFGVYPKDMTKGQILDKVRGTFGGRFESFTDYNFVYIAYTD